MRVPPPDVGKRYFQADARLDQLRNLQQRIAERGTRILGAVLRLVLSRIDLLQIIDRFECFCARSMQRIVDSLITINRFKATLHRR